jgi:hypothetical protein
MCNVRVKNFSFFFKKETIPLHFEWSQLIAVVGDSILLLVGILRAQEGFRGFRAAKRPCQARF